MYVCIYIKTPVDSDQVLVGKTPLHPLVVNDVPARMLRGQNGDTWKFSEGSLLGSSHKRNGQEWM